MTDFSIKVYRAVLSIPLGRTQSYKWVASKAGRPGASRAVGTILKNNPCPLIIPCHRVIKNNKDTGGYIYGTSMKKALLKLEKEVVNCLKSRE